MDAMLEQQITVIHRFHWIAVLQHALFGAIAWATIGVYGSFYLLRGLSKMEPHISSLTVTVRLRGASPKLSYIPESPRDMPILGLVTFGLLGPIAIAVFIVIILPLCWKSLAVRGFLMTYFFRREKFHW